MESYTLYMIGFYDCNIIKLMNLLHGIDITKSGIASTEMLFNWRLLLTLSKQNIPFITASDFRASVTEDT